jgi:peptide chain release factor 1
MLEQLKKIEERYQELEHLLASPEVISSKESYNKLAKELSDLKKQVTLSRAKDQSCPLRRRSGYG